MSANRDGTTMNAIAPRVAIIGSGISGAVCASKLARNGVSVTIFDSGRGPGGRMSHRKFSWNPWLRGETTEDGKEISFDHGAPYFTTSNPDVLELIHGWQVRGLVAEWKESLGSFDCNTKKFVDPEKEGLSKKYVGILGMNSICKALCQHTGVESKFGVTVGRLGWLEDKDSWSLTDLDGQDLGNFKGVVASDKSIFSPRFTRYRKITPACIDLKVVPELAMMIKEVPVSPCFALMLAFEKPLSLIPVKGFSIKNSRLLSRAICETSKPGRSTTSEPWVLHSTPGYAEGIIARAGLQKPSNTALADIAEELFLEFQSTGLDISVPFFKKAHRWGSAFPAASLASDEKCLWDGKKKLAICGDFCVAPYVEGAILSGLTAATRFAQTMSCL